MRHALQLRDGAGVSDTRNQSELPPAADMLEGIALVPPTIFIAATIFPGFLLCVPALAFVGVVAIILIAAVTVLVALAGAILATPFVLVLLVRFVRRHAVGTPASVLGLPQTPQLSETTSISDARSRGHTVATSRSSIPSVASRSADT